MPQQTPNHWQPDPTSTLTLDIAALAALDAALARDHAAQARAEAPTLTPANSFAAALASAGEALL